MVWVGDRRIADHKCQCPTTSRPQFCMYNTAVVVQTRADTAGCCCRLDSRFTEQNDKLTLFLLSLALYIPAVSYRLTTAKYVLPVSYHFSRTNVSRTSDSIPGLLLRIQSRSTVLTAVVHTRRCRIYVFISHVCLYVYIYHICILCSSIPQTGAAAVLFLLSH